MPLHSLTFLLLLAAGLPIYLRVPAERRGRLLLLLSLAYFATFRWDAVLLLLGTALVGYVAGIRLDQDRPPLHRRAVVTLAVGLLVTGLAVNTSAAFLVTAANQLVGRDVLPVPQVVAAAGVSFYIFTCLSYVIDVYRRTTPAEHRPEALLLYLSYFPKVLAGPIVRMEAWRASLDRAGHLSPADLTSGAQLLLWGLFKKVVVADRLAPMVDAAYRLPALSAPADLLLASYLFAFQIYCDFSAYSDMAVGCSRMLGLTLPENFQRPYLAVSVREFWAHRWHRTLSAWFADYLYRPLGGNRRGAWRTRWNLMAVFALSGLWHGAHWTFLVWGGLNGLYVWVEDLLGGTSRRTVGADGAPWVRHARRLVTFHLILLSWIFFRADTVDAAVTILTRIAAAGASLPTQVWLRMTEPAWLVAVALIGVVMATDILDERQALREHTHQWPVAVQWTVAYGLLAMLLVAGQWNLTRFVYMQF